MKINIKKHIVRGEVKWVVDVTHNGKRRRKRFNTQVEAKQFDVLSWLGEKSKKEPMGDKTILSVACDRYLTSYAKRNKNDAKPFHRGLQTTEERVRKFIEWFGDNRLVSEVTAQDWHDYLDNDSWGDYTKKQYGGAVKIFMAWCGKQKYGTNESDWYSTTNKELVIKTTDGKKFHRLPEICSIEETKALLDSMPDKYKPTMAIMFFTGIRADIEMTLLDYSDIQWGKRIGLVAEHTKTGRERWIIPPENLWEWLPKGRGKVNPVTYNAFSQARALAAKRAYGRENNGRRGGGGVKGFDYPANGARHSFGSYGYWRNFEWALDTMGHMSSEVFLKNYKNNRVDKEDSEEYFSIKPPKKKKKTA